MSGLGETGCDRFWTRDLPPNGSGLAAGRNTRRDAKHSEPRHQSRYL